MDQQRFEDLLRQFKRREPFQPFVVELLDGSEIRIEEARLAFNGGAAVYLPPGPDLEIIPFECEGVRDIREAAPQGVAP